MTDPTNRQGLLQRNPPGLSFFWGCMTLLAVKVKVVAEPLTCNMQSSKAKDEFKTGLLRPAAGYVCIV
jgi:hypothetical protein